MPPVVPQDVEVSLDLDVEHVPPPVAPDVHGKVAEVAPVLHQLLPSEGEFLLLGGDVDVPSSLGPAVSRDPGGEFASQHGVAQGAQTELCRAVALAPVAVLGQDPVLDLRLRLKAPLFPPAAIGWKRVQTAGDKVSLLHLLSE